MSDPRNKHEKCGVKDCDKPVRQQGLCGMHAQRLWRTGRLDKAKGKYVEINQHKDTRKGQRGYLEANTIDEIRHHARKRGKKWALTPLEAFTLITSPCVYCGFTPEWPKNRVGIDRVFNDDHYHKDNCVPCCFTCNSAKKEMSLEEFKAWVGRIYEYFYKAG